VGELLLELLSEEIPARMQRRAIDDLVGLVRDKLAGAEIPAGSIEGYVTPRRLTVIADGIKLTQPDRSEERRGPRVGAPEAAIGGFLRAAGLSSLDQCEVRATDRGEFYFAVIRQTGRRTGELLPGLLLAAIGELPWPKSMRFPAAELRWVRPLNSVICLFDGAVVPLALGDVPVGRVTRGHRFLAPGEISVASPADYRDKLEAAHVVLDRERRRQLIADGLAALAVREGLRVKPDDGLLDEVTGLVECPVVLMGRIDADFVRPLPDGLPPEVLATAMRTHQKYFSCRNPDGSPAPRFLFVANNRTADGGAAISAGNERVLRARLSDARFFWDQDRKVRLEDRVEALKDRVFHAKLGSVYDKVERMGRLLYVHELALMAHADTNLAFEAAMLAKADLSTGMVGEFPELQGVMGRYYALDQGKDYRVAQAIADHYKPVGQDDNCPTEPISAAVALADKIDSLIAFFAVGEKPTGSRDPFALRRAALGAIRLILAGQMRIRLRQLIHDGWMNANVGDIDPTDDLMEFITDRLKVHLREQGIRHDLINAALVRTSGVPEKSHLEDDLILLIKRVRALTSFLDTDDGANLLVAYRRAANIVDIEEKKDGRPYNDRLPDSTPGMLKLPQERALNDNLAAVNAAPEVWSEDFTAAMARLARLRQPVDEFFDKVTVNTDEVINVQGEVKSLRENRLRLLSALRMTMNRVADFSQIEG